MQIISTHKALDELSNRQASFTPRQRAVLLLANGQRSAQALSALVGEDVSTDVHFLLDQGLLAPVQVSEPLPLDPPRQADGRSLGTLAQRTRQYLGQVAAQLQPLRASA